MVFLLPAVFGWERLKNEPCPILPLLAGANLPGNVLARFDVLWMGFLLYSLMFSIGSLLFYGHEVIRRSHLGSGKYWMALVVYVLSFVRIKGMGIEEAYGPYLGYVFVPGDAFLSVYAVLRGKRETKENRRRGGCAGNVPASWGLCRDRAEKRMYPLALGIDGDQEGFTLTYAMADLKKATGQEKTEEGGSEGALSITGKDFEEIEEIYNRSQEKYLDMGHLQVLVLGDRLIRERQWGRVLEYLSGSHLWEKMCMCSGRRRQKK